MKNKKYSEMKFGPFRDDSEKKYIGKIPLAFCEESQNPTLPRG